MKKIFTIFFLIFCWQINSAQTIISGKVFDKNSKESLIGANVIIKGTSNGTATNLDGYFKIDSEKKLPITLIISYLGYINKENFVKIKDNLNKEQEL